MPWNSTDLVFHGRRAGPSPTDRCRLRASGRGGRRHPQGGVGASRSPTGPATGSDEAISRWSAPMIPSSSTGSVPDVQHDRDLAPPVAEERGMLARHPLQRCCPKVGVAVADGEGPPVELEHACRRDRPGPRPHTGPIPRAAASTARPRRPARSRTNRRARSTTAAARGTRHDRARAARCGRRSGPGGPRPAGRAPPAARAPRPGTGRRCPGSPRANRAMARARRAPTCEVDRGIGVDQVVARPRLGVGGIGPPVAGDGALGVVVVERPGRASALRAAAPATVASTDSRRSCTFHGDSIRSKENTRWNSSWFWYSSRTSGWRGV